MKRKKRKSKYNAVRVKIDGITFDSIMESKRYILLRDCNSKGIISMLELQPVYPIHIHNKLIGKAIMDFRYIKDGNEVVEDVKGFDTDFSKFKRKCVEAIYGIKVNVIKNKDLGNV